MIKEQKLKKEDKKNRKKLQQQEKEMINNFKNKKQSLNSWLKRHIKRIKNFYKSKNQKDLVNNNQMN